ncbi:GNAT family N-acetyltransferase [Halobaculum sp. WSA2]|uniref:GNAT family N-acetyltransferase n=1 Tax=Halobaculum saliterrae TaxID=2073113 RepID=A0A6B0SQF2_9EURY|nr:GNAT family N-acetyltransferase [Halobaculum saliterrae]MXR41148.1 GNAT family N-acetyltransferase [Halobaculum saliterrae]
MTVNDAIVSTDVTVRVAVEDDLNEVQETLAGSWRRGYDGVVDADALTEATVDPAEFYPAERFERKRAADDLLFLVAVADERVVGVCNVARGESHTHAFVPDDAAQLRAVYVDPAHWGAGVGTALVRRGTDDIDGGTCVYVECLAANERGRRFYESLGFERYDGGTVDLFDGAHPTDRFTR